MLWLFIGFVMFMHVNLIIIKFDDNQLNYNEIIFNLFLSLT